MCEKIMEIQPLNSFFGLQLYYMVKNNKTLKLQGYNMCCFILQSHFSDYTYITGSISIINQKDKYSSLQYEST